MTQVREVPARTPANLTLIKDIEEEHRFDISGYSLKDMTCDPYGHPIFACSDTKAGFVMCYDCEEQRILRRIAPAQHSIDSVAFDSQNNFILGCDDGKERTIAKYNIRGDKLKSFIVEDCEKILGVACSCDDKILTSIRRSEQQCIIRVYKQSGEIITSLINNTRGEYLFIKPAYMAVTGNRLIVGDVGLKNLTAYDLPNSTAQSTDVNKKPVDGEKDSADREKKSADRTKIPAGPDKTSADPDKIPTEQKKTAGQENKSAGQKKSAGQEEKSADQEKKSADQKKASGHENQLVDSLTEVAVDSVWSIKLDIPRGLEVDGGGNIFACDFRNNRLTLINRDGKILGHSITTVSRPQFVSINRNNLYIIDEGRGTTYRMTVYSLHKTHRKNRNKPNWQ